MKISLTDKDYDVKVLKLYNAGFQEEAVVSLTDYMRNGPGRYVSAASFKMFDNFFKGRIIVEI